MLLWNPLRALSSSQDLVIVKSIHIRFSKELKVNIFFLKDFIIFLEQF